MAQTRVVRKAKRASKAPTPRWRRWATIIFATLVALAVVYHLVILFQVVRYRSVNPGSTAMMDQRAREASARGEEARQVQTWVPYDRISQNLVRAVLAGEDSRFFDHGGFDWEEMQKALEKDWNEGKFKRGASTISQQLAKNLFLSTSKNPIRKLNEALITWEMEWILGKRRILEIYLNVIEWGSGVFGAEAAARHHFSVPAAMLGPEQAARLAAMVPSPRRYAPGSETAYLQRRTEVIRGRMNAAPVP
jgi:monofunctional glycosyltransferase